MGQSARRCVHRAGPRRVGDAGDEHPLARLPFRRWREVEIHMVDLDLGFTHSDWPAAFVDRALPTLLDRLPDRSDPRELMVWLLGRGAAPELPPWG